AGTEKLRLLGQAARAHADSGASSAALAMMREMRLVAQSTADGEPILLKACQALTEKLNDHQANLAIMERLLEINPGDTKLRVELALKHSEMGNSDLSLLHYLRIPMRDRDNAAWNNIGVESAKLGLPGKSVDADLSPENSSRYN